MIKTGKPSKVGFQIKVLRLWVVLNCLRLPASVAPSIIEQILVLPNAIQWIRYNDSSHAIDRVSVVRVAYTY